jgi:hypothetical protein
MARKRERRGRRTGRFSQIILVDAIISLASRTNQTTMGSNSRFSLVMDRLFIKIKCSFCNGSGMYSAGGYTNSARPGEWGSCPYCDENRETYIEPTLDIIIDILSDLPGHKKQLIIKRLKQTD